MSERPASGVFVASTGQHVGKTTTSLGLFSALARRVDTVVFMKPVGQKPVHVDSSERVDNDIVLCRWDGTDSGDVFIHQV